MIGGARERRRRAEKAKDRAKMFSFVNGMQVFPRALAASLGERCQLGARVTAVRKVSGSRRRPTRYAVTWTRNGRRSVRTADAVVMAVPAYVCSVLLQQLTPDLASVLNGIYYPPVAEVFLGYSASQVGRTLDGFGFLVPARERRKILGTIWSSTIFPARAPQGHVALTTFVGGSRQPEVLATDDRGLVDMVRRELGELMCVSGKPVYVKVNRWAKAIPQYRIGYRGVAEAIERAESGNPGLHICSNFRGGIAVGDCVMNAKRTSEAIIRTGGGTP
jgi:oxygen-dependent protoporphyrinogen oxidase